MAAETIITVTKDLFNEPDFKKSQGEKGGYECPPSSMPLATYGAAVMMQGNADFTYASKKRYRKLHYKARLIAKELVLGKPSPKISLRLP